MTPGREQSPETGVWKQVSRTSFSHTRVFPILNKQLKITRVYLHKKKGNRIPVLQQTHTYGIENYQKQNHFCSQMSL